MLANFGLKIMPNSGNMPRGNGTISGGNHYIVGETSGNNLGSLCLTDTKWFKLKNECDQVKSLLQLNSYPMCPDADRAMGLAPHTDSSLFILYQGNINGLQFYEDDMEWVDLEPVEGALIVNIGDLMQIVSNGKFKSVLHRVVANNTRHLISPGDAEVLPLKKLVEFDRLPMYRPTVIWKE
ncbi:gibberellin 3-beta-dioxygenase 1-like [Gossypium arboreum]|uniref:gibberellin 3-beta-dioxygenase 1-like n=1 Tax=Gossypium arboreum TaxID=29729 RepID=UPI0022F1C5D8|nr:gibberellin 3-beta-dioxygenase 1-like [Gossypium arboreum]